MRSIEGCCVSLHNFDRFTDYAQFVLIGFAIHWKSHIASRFLFERLSRMHCLWTGLPHVIRTNTTMRSFGGRSILFECYWKTSVKKGAEWNTVYQLNSNCNAVQQKLKTFCGESVEEPFDAWFWVRYEIYAWFMSDSMLNVSNDAISSTHFYRLVRLQCTYHLCGAGASVPNRQIPNSAHSHANRTDWAMVHRHQSQLNLLQVLSKRHLVPLKCFFFSLCFIRFFLGGYCVAASIMRHVFRALIFFFSAALNYLVNIRHFDFWTDPYSVISLLALNRTNWFILHFRVLHVSCLIEYSIWLASVRFFFSCSFLLLLSVVFVRKNFIA